jgi:hypothetical protein
MYDVYNDTVSNSDYMAPNDRMIVNNGLEKMWKEGFPGQDLSLEPPEYGT